MKSDREIAYEQNVTGLEKAWAARISVAAQNALRTYDASHFDPGYDGRHDHVTDVVTSYLLGSEHWENVEATDISDIAYEAATHAVENAD